MNIMSAGFFLLPLSCLLLLTGSAWAVDGTRTETVVQDFERESASIETSEHVAFTQGEGFRLHYVDGSGFASSGEIVSTWVDTRIPANDLVLSWNFDMPIGTGAVMDMRVGDEEGKTVSAWYEMARVGFLPDLSRLARTDGVKRDENGSVVDDTLVLSKKWHKVQYRVTFLSGVSHHSPTLRLIAISSVDRDTPVTYSTYVPSGKKEAWMRSLPVRWRTQALEEPSIAGRICGPTSMSQAMEYLGCNIPTADLAAESYDYANEIFGNWPFLAQEAALHGLKAWVARCQDFKPIEDSIADGRPVVLSLAFNKGELRNSPLSETDGHLILCVGMTPEGDLICNDSCSADKICDHIVYKRDDMATAWLKRGGASIFVAKRAGHVETSGLDKR